MVQGLAEFNTRWAAIPEKVKAAAVEEMEKIATGLVGEMRSLAPDDPATGRSPSEWIDWTWGATPAGGFAVGKVFGQDYATVRLTLYAGTAATMVPGAGGEMYQNAQLQEHGTAEMPANPYFYPVWRARRRSVRSRITRAISKAIKA